MTGTIGASESETGNGALTLEQITAHDRASALDSLTGRELEVLGLIANGDSNSTIAEKLCITPKTVGNHINGICSKLLFDEGVNKRVKVALMYLEGYPFEFIKREVRVDLTPREYEVLSLMAQGDLNLVVAEKLYIQPRTVERHITSIYSKLPFDEGVDKRVMAALMYGALRIPNSLSYQPAPLQLH